jgi:cyanophycinase
MSPAKVAVDQERGWIIPVGGAEDKDTDTAILKRFVEVSGGRDARVAILPTASQLADTGERYEQVFKGLEVDAAYSLPFGNREEAHHDGWLRQLDEATGIFLTGGNQLRISAILGGTPVARAIRRLNACGVSVGGTSAGAAILSEHMIAYGEAGATPHAGQASLSPGLGVTNRVIIDQHFRQRDRLGRLLSALAYNPFAVGLGLDEDTAAFIDPSDVIHVVGSDAITVVDPSALEHSSMPYTELGRALCLTNIKMHILTAGATFDLKSRRASPPPAAPLE